ncbi:hypothetical protein CAPTEDRAFT_204642 [Capitella teleta]|uniref:Uncharacterized protein n=1 Tax=Capitella teleta TaxID=283909 RepID=R7UUH3_CAPTE|nr:hypothetical protein CAPTEDRAFT_204642 [Capitella teleta]|eukprot:ELU07036.1 hypothetical protein CAPTEDRAFT_204642 [Capitella teleta]
MSREREFGVKSNTVIIESSGSNHVTDHTNVFAANWELFAVGVCVFLIITAIVMIIVLRSRPKQGDSEQNKENVSTENSVAQASVLPDNSAGKPAPVTEPSLYEPLETDERRDLSDPYTVLEGVYQEIDDGQLP